MNVLSLCSGIGGLEQGVHIAVPTARIVCYVERDEYCQRILRARIRDGWLDDAPIWSDLRTFDGRRFTGLVDLLTAGYPCQPFSLAGRRLGAADERHLWPEVARIIRECQPALVFLENVPGHVSLGLREVGEELARMGYRLEAGLFSAAEVGAPHRRERLFILWRTPIMRDSHPASRANRTRNIPSIQLAHQVEYWSTPRASDGEKGGPNQSWTGGGTPLPSMAAHWQTPSASVAQDGEQPETWLARREILKARHTNGNGAGMPLTIASLLWPTPQAADSDRGSLTMKRGNPTLKGAALAMWPTPRSVDRKGELLLKGQVKAFHSSRPDPPTPTAGESSSSAGPSSRPPSKRRLNPMFVEWLMGAPFGSTLPAFTESADSRLSETRSSRWLRLWRSRLFGSDYVSQISNQENSHA